jgi:hypothetical protein
MLRSSKAPGTSPGKGGERRRHRRAAASDNVFVSFGTQEGTVGRLADIGKGGLAVVYLFDQSRKDSHCRIDIIARDLDLLVESVPCKVVYDKPIEDQNSLLGMESRRCGLELGPLSDSQATVLKSLLARHGLRESGSASARS